MKIDSPTFLTETTFISASVQFSSGSQKFGDTSDDLHQFTGSISTSGDIDLSGGKLWVGGTNRRVILGPKSDNYEGNRIDIGAGIRLFASGDQHFKGQGVTTTVGRECK